MIICDFRDLQRYVYGILLGKIGSYRLKIISIFEVGYSSYFLFFVHIAHLVYGIQRTVFFIIHLFVFTFDSTKCNLHMYTYTYT